MCGACVRGVVRYRDVLIVTVTRRQRSWPRLSFGRTHVASTLLASQVCLAGGAFVVNILSARGLGPAGRGELALFLQIAYASNLVCLLGRHRSYLATRTVGHTLGQAHREVSDLARLPIALAVGLALAASVGFGATMVAIVALFVGMALKMTSGVFVNTHRAAAIVARDASPYLVATLATQSLLVLAAAAYLALGVTSVPLWLGAYGVTAALPYVAAELVIRRRDPTPGRDHAVLSQARRVGLQLMPASLSETLLRRSDRFLIPALASFEQLGIYAVVTTMVGVLEWPVRQFADSKTPEWADRFDAGDLSVGRELSRGALLASAMTVAVGIATWLTLVPLFGESYRAGIELIIPLSVAHACSAVALLGTSMSVAVRRATLASYIKVPGLICSIPAYLLLIPSHGAVGAAWGHALAYAVSALATVVVYIRFRPTRASEDRSDA